MTRMLMALAAGGLLVLLSTATLGAQAGATAQIGGIVKDESGGVLPGVDITVTQTATGVTPHGSAGVAGGFASNRNYPTLAITVAGGSPGSTVYLMDGATHNDPGTNLNLPVPFPDALQEFKIETSALPAKYGQHASAVVNVATKAGSNQFHGSAFEFNRDGRFNAKNAFAL